MDDISSARRLPLYTAVNTSPMNITLYIYIHTHTYIYRPIRRVDFRCYANSERRIKGQV